MVKNIEGSGARVVRRARKTQLDRSLRRNQEDLDQNLNKVENRLFTQKRVVIATKVFVPEEVRRGVITPELEELERRVCGTSSKKPSDETGEVAMASSPTNQVARPTALAIGFLKLSEIARHVRIRYSLTA